MTIALLCIVAQVALATTAGNDPYCPEGLSIDNDYTPDQAGYYYANLVKGQNVTVTLSETNLRFMVYDHGGKNGDYTSDYSGNSQTLTLNAPEGCVFVVSGTILGIEGFAGDTFELYDGQSIFYSYNEDDYVVIPSHITTSNSLKINFMTPQATSNPGFELTVRVWDKYTEVGTASELTAAVADGALIRLTKDITLPAYLSIGNGVSQTVTLDLNGHTLSRNIAEAYGDGHVIEIHSKGTLTVEDGAGGGKISGGRANNGGGICNYGTLYFQGGTITNCLAAQQGGGIKNNSGATVTMSGGTILGNWGKDCGGIFNAAGGTLNISGGVITGNTSNAGGGGVVNYGTATITGGTIHNNHATTRGGGIWTNATLSIGEATITGNHADINGGGIYCADGGNITIGAGTVINGNVSSNGGGIYGIEGSTLSITGCTVTSNTASEDGGGIVNRGTLTIGNGTSVTNNTCQNNGGGLWSIGTLNMSGTVTIQNNARVGGLTNNVYLSDSYITVTGNLGSSLIGVNFEDNEGRVTSGLSSNGTLSNFTNDRPTITTLAMVFGDVILSKNSGIYYVERSWDATKQQVVETIKAVPESECTFLDGTDDTVDYNTSGSKSYLVVRGTNAYRTITVTGNRSLILCDGASLSGNNKYSIICLEENCQLNIYGQLYDTGELKKGAIRVPAGRKLNIHGGTINAISEVTESAAIGGYDSVRDCGEINIYGGTINATAADSNGHYTSAGIGGSGGGQAGGSGGIISIYGGTVTAHGGSADGLNNSGAGIGGGGSASGGTITIRGGTVYAYGGNDAAGIGSGEESSFSHCNGGNITITGGHVYAYGSDKAAGIGAGQYADMGNITITGGIVEAHGGGGESWANAIATNDDSEGENSITLGDNMMVTSERDFTYPERYDAVKGRKDVIIQPCTHSGATYTVNGTTASGTHTMHCSYCKYSPTGTHTFEDGICSVCHVSGSTSTVSIYLPERVGDGYTDGHYADTPRTQTLVTGSTFDLPAPPVRYLPSGVIFAGWRVGTPAALGITSYWIGESDVDVLEPGTTYTVSGDVSLTARYKGIDISLADNADNSAILYDYNGKLAQTVTLAGRTLYKDGAWNTLCLPFSLNSLAGTPLEGATVKTLESATFADGTLTLNFTADLTAIEAGKPYIVKWVTTGDDVVSPVFINGLEISNSGPIAVTGDAADFVGNYNPYSTGGADNTLLYVGAGDNLHWPNAEMTIGAFHAYFRLNGGLTAGDESSSATVRRTVLNFGDDATGIASPKSSPEGKDFGSPLLQEGTGEALYDLSGRRVNSPLAPGIYIRNGKKIIVK